MVPVCGGVCARRLLPMVGAGRAPLLLALSRARCSQAGGTGPGRAPDIKKRGYDITRNPHLNKVRALAGAMQGRAQPGGGEGGGRGPGPERRCPGCCGWQRHP